MRFLPARLCLVWPWDCRAGPSSWSSPKDLRGHQGCHPFLCSNVCGSFRMWLIMWSLFMILFLRIYSKPEFVCECVCWCSMFLCEYARMSAYGCKCIYICVHVSVMCVSVYMCTCVYMLGIYLCLSVYMWVSVWVCLCLYGHACIYMYVRVCLYVYVCITILYLYLCFFVYLILSFKKYLKKNFLERGNGGKKREKKIDVREIHWSVAPLVHTPTRDWTHNPGMCCDLGSNQWPFALLDDAQVTEPHQSEHCLLLSKTDWTFLLYHSASNLLNSSKTKLFFSGRNIAALLDIFGKSFSTYNGKFW